MSTRSTGSTRSTRSTKRTKNKRETEKSEKSAKSAVLPTSLMSFFLNVIDLARMQIIISRGRRSALAMLQQLILASRNFSYYTFDILDIITVTLEI